MSKEEEERRKEKKGEKCICPIEFLICCCY
jgi:hypothetical protein